MPIFALVVERDSAMALLIEQALDQEGVAILAMAA
jgi:hypothetical protein